MPFPYGVFLARYIWKGCLLCSEAIISLVLNILGVTVTPKIDECAANLTCFHLSESRAQIKDIRSGTSQTQYVSLENLATTIYIIIDYLFNVIIYTSGKIQWSVNKGDTVRIFWRFCTNTWWGVRCIILHVKIQFSWFIYC